MTGYTTGFPTLVQQPGADKAGHPLLPGNGRNMTDKSKKNLLTLAAVCSFIGALTTALLIFLPNPSAPDSEARARLHENGLYLSKLWILFIHPQVNFMAVLGMGYLLWRKNAALVIPGTLFLAVWAYTEMSQQALLIDALNNFWRPEYLRAASEADKAMYTTLITGTTAISDSKYFLVIYGFGAGSLLYGLAMLRERGAGRWIGISLIFIGMLSLASFARYYLGATAVHDLVNNVYKWIYSYLQPLVRVAIGLWILSETRKFNHRPAILSA